jgi:hypothetical protein
MNSARKTKTRDNMFKYTSADIAEAAEEIIIVMTDAHLGLTMPGTKSLAEKFGAPEKSTGLKPDIGSIVVQTTDQGKQIWHLISKFHAKDKLQMKTHRFYKKPQCCSSSTESQIAGKQSGKCCNFTSGCLLLGCPVAPHAGQNE